MGDVLNIIAGATNEPVDFTIECDNTRRVCVKWTYLLGVGFDATTYISMLMDGPMHQWYKVR